MENNNLKLYYYRNPKDNINGSYIVCISDSLESAKKSITKELNIMGLLFNDSIEIKVNDIVNNEIIYSCDGDF